jgi:hypothetical protein
MMYPTSPNYQDQQRSQHGGRKAWPGRPATHSLDVVITKLGSPVEPLTDRLYKITILHVVAREKVGIARGRGCSEGVVWDAGI